LPGIRLRKQADEPERTVIDEGLACGKAVYDRGHILDLSVIELAGAG